MTLDLLNYKPEDGGILDCWRETVGDQWLYVDDWNLWYHWTGAHWTKDKCLALPSQIERLLNGMNEAARTALAALPPAPAKKGGAVDPHEGERAALRAMVTATNRSQARVSSIATMAQAGRAVAADCLDQGNLLNLANGTLDLSTMRLHGHRQSDHLTDCLSYAFDRRAQSPRWEQFCREVLVKERAGDAGDWQTDDELVELLQEAIGYTLTTETAHEAMFWLCGKPNSGKSTIGHVLRLLLGDMTLSVDFDRLGQPGDYTLADVPGKRVLTSTESRKGGRFAESLVKQLVSGDAMTTARKFGHPFQFRSVAKIWWMMNDKPTIADTSGAIWRRMYLFPFNRTFSKEERDTALLAKLEAELPGILNWALEGLERLRARGRFPEPKAVEDALEEYRRESNPVALWLEECATVADSRGLRPSHTGALLWTAASECFQNYSAWAQRNGRQSMNSTSFGRELARLVRKQRTETGMAYQLGLRL